MRLGAWVWLACESARRADLPVEGGGLDDSSRMIVALLGLYYLGSGI